jgi:glycosyltransferase involved in cell wall biosynthesis
MALRVLYVNAAGSIAGAENSLLELLAGLDRDRFQPLAAVPGPGPLSGRLREAGVPCAFVPLSRPSRTLRPGRLVVAALRTASAAVALARVARRWGASLLHAQGGAAQLVAGPAAALAGVPCVWHVRDLRHVPIVTPVLARLADGVIAVSRAALEAARIRPVPGSVVRLVPNAIDAEAFASRAGAGELRRELALPSDVPLVLVAAQMVPWKGHADFLRALAVLRRRRPRAVAVLAGEDLFGDHPGYIPGLRRLAADLGLRDAVHFAGYRTDVPTLMADADLLCVPSREEPFGRVALEAMAVGTPVVGRGVGGLADVVEDGVTGLLARTQSPLELARLMAALLTDSAARRAMSRAGRRRVRERFALDEHVERVCRVYEEVLAARR